MTEPHPILDKVGVNAAKRIRQRTEESFKSGIVDLVSTILMQMMSMAPSIARKSDFVKKN